MITSVSPIRLAPLDWSVIVNVSPGKPSSATAVESPVGAPGHVAATSPPLTVKPARGVVDRQLPGTSVLDPIDDAARKITKLPFAGTAARSRSTSLVCGVSARSTGMAGWATEKARSGALANIVPATTRSPAPATYA